MFSTEKLILVLELLVKVIEIVYTNMSRKGSIVFVLYLLPI
jgi:hypothetical protein